MIPPGLAVAIPPSPMNRSSCKGLGGLPQLTSDEGRLLIFEMRRDDVPFEEALDRAKVLIEIGRGVYKPLPRKEGKT